MNRKEGMRVAVARLLVAGTHSGVGKTTISTGIMAALRNRGLAVQGFKVGPDYIDPGFHTWATGRVSRNLDTWLLGEERVPEIFRRCTGDADVAVIEGVMGMFDGARGSDDWGSSAHIARLLHCPVILILDVRSMARSAAAVVHGYSTLDPGINVAGVILNRVGGDHHYQLLKEAIEGATGIRVVGCLRRDDRLTVPERHLGLTPQAERGDSADDCAYLARQIEQGLDLDALLEIARQAPEGNWPDKAVFPEPPPVPEVRIAVARDEAFHFYYQDSLDFLEALGAELVPFSPLYDKRLPADISGIIIGGGFPELWLERLAENWDMIRSLREAAGAGMPLYAECGGLLYLCRSAAGFEGREYPLVGLVPAVCTMEKSLAAMGYVEATARTDNLFCRKEETLRGHVFHYSRTRLAEDSSRWAFSLAGSGKQWLDGYAHENILASYLHLHLAGNPGAAVRFLEHCVSWNKGAAGKGRGRPGTQSGAEKPVCLK